MLFGLDRISALCSILDTAVWGTPWAPIADGRDGTMGDGKVVCHAGEVEEGPGPERFRRQGGAITSMASSLGQDEGARPQAGRGAAEEVYVASWGWFH